MYPDLGKNFCVALIPCNSNYTNIVSFVRELAKKNSIKFDVSFIPKIMLIEPFSWDEKNEYFLTDSLKKYANQSVSFELELSGFVKKNNDFSLKIEENIELRNFQKSLKYYLEIHNKIVFENYSIDSYKPELCLELNIDTTRKHNKIWKELSGNTLNLNFIANKLHLLHYNSGSWKISNSFELD